MDNLFQPTLKSTMNTSRHSRGLKLQKTLQSLVKLRGGTRVARFLARKANSVYFKGQWFAQARDLHCLLDVQSEIELQLLLYGGFDQALLRYLASSLSPGDTFVDVGANIGAISIPAAAMVGPAGHVFSFEADPQIFDKLTTNINFNSLPQLEPLKEALGSESGVKTFYRPPSNGVFSEAVGSLYASEWHSGDSAFDVEIRTLDSVLQGRNINQDDFIKIDVEGAEIDVLKGSLQTLERHQPTLCIEVCAHTYDAAGWNTQDLMELLLPFGYRFEVLDGRSGLTRPLSSHSDTEFLNLIARAR
jgi:FkbM family methyltransferase